LPRKGGWKRKEGGRRRKIGGMMKEEAEAFKAQSDL